MKGSTVVRLACDWLKKTARLLLIGRKIVRLIQFD